MTSVRVQGMTCQGCESVVETAVEMLDNVQTVDADRYENVVTVEGDVTVEEVADKVELAGYTAHGAADEPNEQAGDDADAGDAAEEASAEASAEEEPVEAEAPADLDEDELEE